MQFNSTEYMHMHNYVHSVCIYIYISKLCLAYIHEEVDIKLHNQDNVYNNVCNIRVIFETWANLRRKTWKTNYANLPILINEVPGYPFMHIEP